MLCGRLRIYQCMGRISHELKLAFHLPKFPLMYTTSWLCEQKYGWNFKEASSLKQVEKADLPMFFIHGDKDTYVPTWMVYPPSTKLNRIPKNYGSFREQSMPYLIKKIKQNIPTV